MSTAPCSAIEGSSRRKTSVAASRVGPPMARSLSIAPVVGANVAIVLAAGGDEMAQERDPVAIVLIEAIPERAQPRPSREVGQQRGLAVAGVRKDEDHAVVDLGGQPIEQPVPGERLVTQRRALDLRGLDRVPVHSVAEGSMRERAGGRRLLRAYGER